MDAGPVGERGWSLTQRRELSRFADHSQMTTLTSNLQNIKRHMPSPTDIKEITSNEDITIGDKIVAVGDILYLQAMKALYDPEMTGLRTKGKSFFKIFFLNGMTTDRIGSMQRLEHKTPDNLKNGKLGRISQMVFGTATHARIRDQRHGSFVLPPPLPTKSLMSSMPVRYCCLL